MMLRIISIGVLAAILSLMSCTSKPDVVSINGRSILINNDPYLIKGICYHPVPIGEQNRDFGTLTEDLKLMKEVGINTIRVYVPIIEDSVLDEISDAGLKVIIGFGYNQDGIFDILSGSCIDYVKKYKNHPAILMWELGNEYNYHPEWFEGDIDNWYEALQITAGKIHETDPSHPVTTAHGELPTQSIVDKCPGIDVWGMNVYRWDSPGTIFDDWAAISSKPMYLSEAGADSYMTIDTRIYQKGLNEKAQADAVNNILTEIFAKQDICSGVTLFAFVDELWKAGDPGSLDPGGWAPNSSGVPYDGTPNEEYWGILDIDRNKKEAFKVVKQLYTK